MTRKRGNGEGSIYLRKDGRWGAAAMVPTASGYVKRIQLYAKSRAEAHRRLMEALDAAAKGVPTPDRQVILAEYLDYWLEQHVKTTNKPKTYEQYEIASRLYLKPGLGGQSIRTLSVPMVQAFLNWLLAEGHSVRKVQIIRTTLSAALTRAEREELVSRNVARLVAVPQWERAEIHPWSADEAADFLKAAETHSLYAAFLLLVTYGMRRGEVLGLRWRDVGFDDDKLCIRQQLQRIGRSLVIGPVKTRSGERDLPLMPVVKDALRDHLRRQEAARLAAGADWAGSADGEELVFTTRHGTSIEPRNFVRSYWWICRANNVRVIKLHHIRHTAATMMKDLGVPARDTQFILGHASSWMTEQIYQHDTMGTKRENLIRVERALKERSRLVA